MPHTHSADQSSSYINLAAGCELTVIQASDSRQCALALSFDAGSHHEPVEYLGMAHFLEHLVFRGSQQYALDDGLMAFVQRHGGQINAQTQAQKTLFHFQIESSLFLDALKRLVDMLVSPRLDEAMLASEREVLNEEFLLYCQAPQILLDMALSASLLETHPLQRFYAGNRETLAIEDTAFKPALMAFHQAAYLRSRLKIVLVLPESWALWQDATLAALQPMIRLPRNTPLRPLADLLVPAKAMLRLELPVDEQYFVLHVPLNRGGQGLQELAEKMQHALALHTEQSFLSYAEQQGWCSSIAVRVPYWAQEQAVLTIQFKRLAGDLDGLLPAFYTWLKQWGAHLYGAECAAYELQAASNRWLSAGPLGKAQLLLAERWPLQGVSTECLDAFSALLAALENEAFVQLLAGPNPVQGRYDQGLPLRLELLRSDYSLIADGLAAAYFNVETACYDSASSFPVENAGAYRALAQHQTSGLPSSVAVCYWGWLVADPQDVFQRLQAKLALLVERFSYNAVYWQLELLPQAVFIRISAPADYLPMAVNQLLAELERPLSKAADRASSPFALRRLLQQLPAVLVANGTAEAAVEIALADQPQAALWLAEAAAADQLETRFLQRLQVLSASTVQLTALTGWQQVRDSSSDALLVLYIPMTAPSVSVLDRMRVINKVFAQYFQSLLQRRLRDELSLCYAVFALPHMQLEREGLVCAVQSSKVSACALLAEVEHCLAEFMTSLAEHLAKLRANVVLQIEQLEQRGQSPESVSQRLFRHWCEQRLGSGWQDEVASIGLLTDEDFANYFAMIQDQKNWLLLSNQTGNIESNQASSCSESTNRV